MSLPNVLGRVLCGRRLHLLLLAACLFAPAVRAAGAPAVAASAADQRLIILGFDGADAATVQSMMEAGQLPNLRRLSEQGTFAPLLTTNPAESPTAWASVNTGRNPAKTGIPGFVKRKEGTTFPTTGHIELDAVRTLEEFRETPIPTWSETTVAAVAGGGAFLLFLFVLAALLRLNLVVSLVIALLMGAIGGWAGFQARGLLPADVEIIANPLKVAPFWETAAQQGVPSVVLAAAQSFDREPVEGAQVLAGLGVPDANGDVQSFFIYTTDELWFPRSYTDRKAGTGSGGLKVRVDERGGAIEGEVFGPVNFWEVDRMRRAVADLEARANDSTIGYKESIALQDELQALKDELTEAEEVRVTLPLQVEKRGNTAAVTLGEETQELAEGAWSDWYHLTFALNPLLKVRAITRAKIVTMDEPFFELYVDTLQIDPAAPPFWQPISMPASFASDLAAEIGPYETIGWACATMPFKDEVLDPVSFMQEIEFTLRTRERMTKAALERNDWRILMSVLSTPDRVQHMMYQFYDPENPMHDPEAAARTMEFFGERITLAEAVPAIYRQVDRIVGEVLDEYVGPDDTLLLCADHGFQSFKRQVHINNWLLEKGYLALKDGVTTKNDHLLSLYVDWSKTKAYSLGLGMVYLNEVGDGPDGIVSPDEEKALLQQIRADFLASVDPETGQRIGREAYVMSEIHSGPYLDVEADMMLGFDRGYRVSWTTSSGGMKVRKAEDGTYEPAPTYEDNDKTWSGDHTSMAEELVTGMFFSNRRIALPADGVNVLHIAPTALALFGCEIPGDYDRPPLAFED